MSRPSACAAFICVSIEEARGLPFGSRHNAPWIGAAAGNPAAGLGAINRRQASLRASRFGVAGGV
jgi:hypothetical protein